MVISSLKTKLTKVINDSETNGVLKEFASSLLQSFNSFTTPTTKSKADIEENFTDESMPRLNYFNARKFNETPNAQKAVAEKNCIKAPFKVNLHL